MALSDADLDAAWTRARSKNGPQWVPYFEALRAVEALVRKDCDALILQLVEALEPLTDEQLAEMMRDTWGCASIAPRHALEFARAVERAHGITQKGGQHGTE